MYKQMFTNPVKTAKTIINLCNNISVSEGLYFRELAENIINPNIKNNTIEELKYLSIRLRPYIRYTLDVDGIELLKEPIRLIEELNTRGYIIGDCDDITLFSNLVLKMIGYNCGCKIIKMDNDDYFGHIYSIVEIDNCYIPFDLSTDEPIGYEYDRIKEFKIFIEG